MKDHQKHTRQDMTFSTVRHAVCNHALAWLVHMLLDKGITKLPPTL